MNDLLYPNKCPCCTRAIPKGETLCASCRKTLRRIEGERCMRCGREIYACDCRAGDFRFERCVSSYRYDGSASGAVLLYKNGGQNGNVTFLSKTVADQVAADYADLAFDCVTAVPPSLMSRLIRRAEPVDLLGAEVAKLLSIPYKRLLSCRLGGAMQKASSRVRRFKNVRGKFKARADVKGMTVLLIDDVMTTGSTLNECARVLRKAGAAQVYCATFATTYKK